MKVHIEVEEKRTIFVVIIDELPPGYNRNPSTLKYLLMAFEKGQVFDPTIDLETKKFFCRVSDLLLAEQKKINWQPRGLPYIHTFIYKEDFNVDLIRKFDDHSFRLNPI